MISGCFFQNKKNEHEINHCKSGKDDTNVIFLVDYCIWNKQNDKDTFKKKKIIWQKWTERTEL